MNIAIDMRYLYLPVLNTPYTKNTKAFTFQFTLSPKSYLQCMGSFLAAQLIILNVFSLYKTIGNIPVYLHFRIVAWYVLIWLIIDIVGVLLYGWYTWQFVCQWAKLVIVLFITKVVCNSIVVSKISKWFRLSWG